MPKILIFICCSCIILVLTIINLSIGPIISGRANNWDIMRSNNWGTLNCQYYKDRNNDDKDSGISGDRLKYGNKWAYNDCLRRKGMYDMEYTSFIFDAVIGFVCGLLGLLHHFEVKKDFVPKTGYIGLGCGIVGFVLSFVYVILNGLVYTTSDSSLIKRNSDGVFAEKTGTPGQFKCIYYDKPYNIHSLYAKISDLIKKQYNYDEDLYENINSDCIEESYYYNYKYFPLCESGEIIPGPSYCDNIYAPEENEIYNKDLSNRFLTSLILSLFVCLANAGLAIFGFLLTKNP